MGWIIANYFNKQSYDYFSSRNWAYLCDSQGGGTLLLIIILVPQQGVIDGDIGSAKTLVAADGSCLKTGLVAWGMTVVQLTVPKVGAPRYTPTHADEIVRNFAICVRNNNNNSIVQRRTNTDERTLPRAECRLRAQIRSQSRIVGAPSATRADVSIPLLLNGLTAIV